MFNYMVIAAVLLVAPASAANLSTASAAETTAATDFTRAVQQVAGLDVRQARAFYQKLQSAVASNQVDVLVGMITIPLRVHTAGKKMQTYNAKKFRQNYARIFTPHVKAALQQQSFEQLFVNYQGLMVGAGELWISGVIDASGQTRICLVTVNN
jgi:hypothetical protein